jgi:hypothetical protein
MKIILAAALITLMTVPVCAQTNLAGPNGGKSAGDDPQLEEMARKKREFDVRERALMRTARDRDNAPQQKADPWATIRSTPAAK